MDLDDRGGAMTERFEALRDDDGQPILDENGDMWINDDHPEASTIVLRAIRRHLAATESGIKGYHNDPSKCEEIDESIRRIRVAKCATSIIGFAPLNRLLSLQEDVLESVVVDHGPLDHDAFSLLTTLTLATNAYIDSQESASAGRRS